MGADRVDGSEGRTNREVAEVVDLHFDQVGLWRKRYEEYGGWPVSTTSIAVGALASARGRAL